MYIQLESIHVILVNKGRNIGSTPAELTVQVSWRVAMKSRQLSVDGGSREHSKPTQSILQKALTAKQEGGLAPFISLLWKEETKSERPSRVCV
jgi:hypothetical protein